MPNVALVVLDTLRKDAFDIHFDDIPGTVIDHAWATTHWTVGSHASLFTGLYASETGVYGTNPQFDFEGDTLAESLREGGYRTRGFSCNPFITGTFEFVRGFEEVRRNWSACRLDPDIFDWGDFESNRKFNGPLRFIEAIYRVVRSDCRTIESLKHGLQRKLYFDNSGLTHGDKGAQQVRRHLRRTEFGDDEFYFINLMEAHGPYRCPSDYQTVKETNDGASFADIIGFSTLRAENTRTAYNDCARYLADVYEKIHSELQESFDYIITVADHGECLGEDDNWGHNFGLHPAVTNVPFSIWAGDGTHKRIDNEATVGLVDAYATVLGRAGVEQPTGRRGVDLFEETPECPRLTEYHGLIRPEIADRILEHGFNRSVVEAYDSWLRGIALNPCNYGFETVVEGEHSFRVTGGEDSEVIRQAMEREHNGLNKKDAGEPVGYSQSIREELDYLGYL